jgi:hypothetical protein
MKRSYTDLIEVYDTPMPATQAEDPFYSPDTTMALESQSTCETVCDNESVSGSIYEFTCESESEPEHELIRFEYLIPEDEAFSRSSSTYDHYYDRIDKKPFINLLLWAYTDAVENNAKDMYCTECYVTMDDTEGSQLCRKRYCNYDAKHLLSTYCRIQ